MRVAVLCHGTVLQPALEALYSQNLLVGLGVPERMAESRNGLEQATRQAGIPFVRIAPTGLEDQLREWLEASAADVVCTMGFPYRIPETVLNQPKFGFFNLHGGPLPRYRGPDPVFWQIRNREPTGAVTVHRITPQFDSGEIALAETVPIGPEDTYGLYMQRIGAVLPRLLIEFVQQLEIHGDGLPLAVQPAAGANYWKRPADMDFTVDWDDSAEAIRALVRACNPVYGGALTTLKGIPVRILQVTDGGPSASLETPPGCIVAASPEKGIQAACGRGQSLSIDIICAEDGFFTGQQLVKLFSIRAGDRLHS